MAGKEIIPMTKKEYIEWYKERYSVEPPIRFLERCLDSIPVENDIIIDDLEDWLS